MLAGPSQPIAISRPHSFVHDGCTSYLDSDADAEVLMYPSPRPAQSPSSISIHPYPLFAASSFGHNRSGSMGSMGSYTSAAGSIGSRFYPAASPGQILNPLDPNEFKCRLPSSVESSHTAFFKAFGADAARRELELCQNYRCCGERLHSMHSLVDHYEEEHVVVVDTATGYLVQPMFSAPSPVASNSQFPALRSSASSSSLAGALDPSLSQPKEGSKSAPASSGDPEPSDESEFDMEMGMDMNNMDMGTDMDMDMELEASSSSSASSASAPSPASLSAGTSMTNSPHIVQSELYVGPDGKKYSHMNMRNLKIHAQLRSGGHAYSPTPPDTPELSTPMSGPFTSEGFIWGVSALTGDRKGLQRVSLNDRQDDPSNCATSVDASAHNVMNGCESRFSESFNPEMTVESDRAVSQIAENPAAFDTTVLSSQDSQDRNYPYRHEHTADPKRSLRMTLSHPYSRVRLGPGMTNRLMGGSSGMSDAGGMCMGAYEQQYRLTLMSERNPLNAYAPYVAEWSAGLPGAMGNEDESIMSAHSVDGASPSTFTPSNPIGNLTLSDGVSAYTVVPSDTNANMGHYNTGAGPTTEQGFNPSAHGSYAGEGNVYTQERSVPPSLLSAHAAAGFDSSMLPAGSDAAHALQSQLSSRSNSPSYNASSTARPLSRTKFIGSSYSNANTTSMTSSNASTALTLSRPSSSLLLSKPFKCPKPGCTKSYKQANGLKYHVTHGSCSFTPPVELASLEGLSEQEAEKRLKPFSCQVPPCQRRYKNMNGLRYHYQHSGEHGAQGLALLASGNHDATKSHPSPPSITVDTSMIGTRPSGTSSIPMPPPSPVSPDIPQGNLNLRMHLNNIVQDLNSSLVSRFGRHSVSGSGSASCSGSGSQTPVTPSSGYMPSPLFGGAGFGSMQAQVMSQPPSAYASPWGSPRLGASRCLSPMSGVGDSYTILPSSNQMHGQDWQQTPIQGDILAS